MSLCGHCMLGSYNGFPPEGSPVWEVGTVYFWCPMRESHEQVDECQFHQEGKPHMYDKKGRLMRCSTN